MFGSKIKIDKELMRKVKMYSEIAGYASVEEFITHTLEKEIEQLEDALEKAETQQAAQQSLIEAMEQRLLRLEAALKE